MRRPLADRSSVIPGFNSETVGRDNIFTITTSIIMSTPKSKKPDLPDDKKPAKKKAQSTGLKGRTAQQVMAKHIRDKNDVISEEDFENLIIGADVIDTTHQPLEITDDSERPKDEDKDPDIITPWDLVR